MYWDIREGLDDAPREREGQSFWLEDGTGRVLVNGTALDVDARPQRRQAVLAAVETDLAALTSRLKTLKALRGKSQGTAERDLAAERARLSLAVTLLCAIRAQARGRLHLKGLSLHQQDRWIRDRAHLTEGGPGANATRLIVERWEVVLQEGQQVEVEGIVSIEPAPSELARGTSYRDVATISVLRPAHADGVRVTGLGAVAPPTVEERRAWTSYGAPREAEAGSRSDFAPAIAVGVTLAVVVAALVAIFGR